MGYPKNKGGSGGCLSDMEAGLNILFYFASCWFLGCVTVFYSVVTVYQ